MYTDFIITSLLCKVIAIQFTDYRKTILLASLFLTDRENQLNFILFYCFGDDKFGTFSYKV